MSSIWRRRRKFLAFSMLRRFPKENRHSGVHCSKFSPAALQNIASVRRKSQQCPVEYNAQCVKPPTLQVGEEDGLKLKKRDLSISPIRRGGGKNHRFSRFLNPVPCHDGGVGGWVEVRKDLIRLTRFF